MATSVLEYIDMTTVFIHPNINLFDRFSQVLSTKIFSKIELKPVE